VTLILIRHAHPVISPTSPPSQWPLSPAGRAAAAALSFPSDAYLVASTEPKAIQTLAPSGPVVQDERFGEVRREGEPFGGNFHELRLAYVSGTDHPLWEPRTDAVRRFDAALTDHFVRAAGRPLVVGSHGMVLTLWLTARIGLDSPGAFWSALRLPDVFAVDLDGRCVERVASTGASRPSTS
jgi:2,3-bisphosphoglycerate-dependent phosphoglycerate mutase